MENYDNNNNEKHTKKLNAFLGEKTGAFLVLIFLLHHPVFKCTFQRIHTWNTNVAHEQFKIILFFFISF